MSYVALYRKYRPKTFEDVVGQDIIIKILRNSIINNKVGHAYLFSGPRGTGKTSVAKIFAKAVNCENNKDGDVCNKCKMCKKIDEDFIDIIEIDAASNNGVDEIREIRNNVKLLPTYAKYKVYIIDEVHMLSSGAFNALLKTLEEPPAHVIFILATTEIQKIPLTIVSRCQKFDFKKIPYNLLKERLKYIIKKESKTIKEDLLEEICKNSDGVLRDAINLVDQMSSATEEFNNEDIYNLSGEVKRECAEQLFDFAVNNEICGALNTIEELYQKGKNFNNITDKLLLLVRDILINNSISNYFSPDYAEELSKYIRIPDEKLRKASKILLDLSADMKKSLNQKIIFEIYFINICSLFEKEEVFNIEVKNEFNQKLNDKTDKILDEIIESKENLISIRVNNSLAMANKSLLKELNEKFDLVESYIANKLYNNVARILMESKIVVASENYLLFSIKKDAMADIFNSNIVQIEKLIEKIYKNHYNVIAVSDQEWDKIKKDYIIKKKEGFEYKIIVESKELKDQIMDLSNTENKAINIFGEDSVSVK